MRFTFRTSRPKSLCALVAVGMWLVCHAAHAASPDPIDIDDDLRAQIQKEKTKQRRDMANATRSGKSSGSSDNCGQIDIGNEPEKKGSKAVSDKQKTVIITGPVINATKCGR